MENKENILNNNGQSDKRQSIPFLIGGICIITYLIRYILPNILSVFSPQFIENGIFDKQQIGLFTSVYCLLYAVGQLINGIVGDYVKPKYMVLIGLTLSGTACIFFALVKVIAVQTVFYGIIGIGLSMLRGPLVKTISENLEKKLARFCCAFLSFVSFVGPFVVSIFALFMNDMTVFVIWGIVCYVFALVMFLTFGKLEKKGFIKLIDKKREKSKVSFLSVFKLKNFVIYLFLGMIYEITSSSIAFWRPTFLTEYLGFSSKISGLITSVMAFVCAFCPFLSLFFCKLFKENDILTTRILLVIAPVCYLAMYFIFNQWVDIALFSLALLSTLIASSVMWSFFIPGLASSGCVSSANGILDSAGYFAASLMNLLLNNIVSVIGWKGTILLWGALPILGILISLFAKSSKKINE